MAEVKAEALCEGENGDRDASMEKGSHPLSPDLPMIPDDVNSILGTMTKAPSGPVEPDSKDFGGPESIIPLSPQWLFTKHGDGKLPMTPIDLPQTPISSSNGGSSDSVSKERWKPDGNRDGDKRRDWWRTMSTEADGGAGTRRDRWREDERESSLLGRRDRWKEGGDATDARRADRWAENLSTPRDPVESRRAPPSERRSDPANRETNYEGRRDSKWNTRWGPEDKEKETRREKRSEFEKEGEGYRDRQHINSSRNENEREADASSRDRWRPHSITARSKGEMPPLSITPPKTAPGFGTGRGRGDSTPSGFSVGRGRANFPGSGPLHGSFPSIGSPPSVDRGDAGAGFRYPRAKLLDIYRKCSSSFSNRKLPEGFIEVPQLTQAEPFEPLAFFTPDMDEEAILEGVLKGDVLSSGTVHSATKEQTNSKTRENGGWNRARGRSNASKEEVISEATIEDKASGVNAVLGQDIKPLNVKHAEGMYNTDVDVNAVPFTQMEGNRKGDNTFVKTSQQSDVSDDVLDISSNIEVVTSTLKSDSTGDFQRQNSMIGIKGKYPGEKLHAVGNQGFTGSAEEHYGGFTLGGSYDDKQEVFNKLNEIPADGQISGRGDREDALNIHIAPEELSLFYIDPQGEVQGPFPGVDIIDWFKAGFFGTDLLVRIAESPEGTPFSQLSKVMPHLQTNSQVLAGRDATEEVEDHEESREKVIEETLSSKFSQQVAVDPTLQVGRSQQHNLQNSVARTIPTGRVGNLNAEDGQFSLNGNVDGRRDMMIDKLLERERSGEAAVLKRAASLPQRMAGVPHAQREDLQSLLAQQWPERDNMLQEVSGLIPRTPGHAANRPEPQDIFLPPPVGLLDRSWSDLSLSEASPHQLSSLGLDAFHIHQLQQLEKYRIQQQLELGVPLPQILQQQQQTHLPGVLRQQQLAEQLLSPGHSHDFNLHALQQLAGTTRLPPRQLQQQQSFPMQASESTLDQLLRLQQQTPSHAYLEQFLRQHQQFPLVEQLHGSPILSERHLCRLQESSRTDLQMEQLLQRHSHELLLQRQQEHQARQHAYLLQQQLSNLTEHRVTGVWEVDEFGQFVQTQVSAPMHSHENFHHQQLQRQPSFPPMQHPGALHVGVSGSHGSQPRLSRSELRRLEVQRNLSSLLEGTSSMPADKLAQLQGEIARFEAQNLSMADQVPFELQVPRNQKLHSQAETEGETVAGGGWGTGHDIDKQVREMLLSRKNELPVSNWQQSSFSLQSDLNTRSKIPTVNFEENLDSVSRTQRRAEKLSDLLTSEDRSRVLGSHSSFQGQRGSSPGIPFNEQQAITNLWTGEQVSSKPKPWDADWPKADTSLRTVNCNDLSGAVGEVRAATPSHFNNGGDFVEPKDPRKGKKLPPRSKVDEDVTVSALVSESDAAGPEDIKDVLPSIPSTHFSVDLQKVMEDQASSRLAMWSVDLNKQAKAANLFKEFQEVERMARNEQEGLPLVVQQQMQSNKVTLPNTMSPIGNASAWPRAASPSLSQSSTPFPHNNAVRSSTQGDDDESFWDYNNTGNLKQSLRTERLDKFLVSRREQLAKGPSVNESENFSRQSYTTGAAHNTSMLSGFSTAVSKPVQPNVKILQPSKQSEDVPVLAPQASLTIADAKAFREWCEEQINMRREHELTEFSMDYLGSGPTVEALKAEFLRHRESMPSETVHVSLPVGDRESADSLNAGTEKRKPAKPKKSSEGEEELELETAGQNSALKNAKKKAKKGKKVVDPSLLGFSVTSNRILMGEIQHIND